MSARTHSLNAGSNELHVGIYYRVHLDLLSMANSHFRKCRMPAHRLFRLPSLGVALFTVQTHIATVAPRRHCNVSAAFRKPFPSRFERRLTARNRLKQFGCCTRPISQRLRQACYLLYQVCVRIGTSLACWSKYYPATL